MNDDQKKNMKNILLTIAYDGSCFNGWQRQREDFTDNRIRSVQGELEKALTHTLGKSITVDGTSRTDTGVHAMGQRASFQCDINVPVDKLPAILNNSLSKGRSFNERIPGEISIIEAREMPLNFHARFDSVGKKYIYKIISGSEQDIFKRNFYYQLTGELDIIKMQEATNHIIGTHDFKSFETSGGTQRETTVRTVHSLSIKEKKLNDRNEIWIEITGDGFLYNMVRIITGTLVETGAGKLEPEDIKGIIDACDRGKAGHTAPPSGLYLKEVYYNEDAMNRGSDDGE